MTGSGNEFDGGDGSSDRDGSAAADDVDVLHVDGDGTVRQRVQSYVESEYPGVSVVGTADLAEARATLERGTVDVLVVEPATSGLDAERLVAAADVPVVCYTDAAPEALPAAVYDATDTFVEKWTAAEGLDFLVEKALAATRRDERTTRLSRAFDHAGGEGDKSCQFLVYEDGTTVWASESLAAFFDRRGVETTVPAGPDFYRTVGGVLAGEPETVRSVRAAGATEPVEFALPTADGKARFRYVEREFPETFGPVRLVVVEDVTADAREGSRVELLELLDGAVRDGVSVVDADGYVEYHNEAFASILGYEDMVGTHTASFMAPGELERGQRAVRRLLDDPDRTSDVLDMEFVTADGERRTLAVHFAVRESDDGYAGVVNVARDVTERREREHRLEAYRRLVDNAGDPMYVADADGRIRLSNEAMETLFYAGDSSLAGTALADLFPAGGVERIHSAVSRAHETGERTTCEVRLPDVGERERRFELTVAALEGPEPEGRPDHITDRPDSGDDRPDSGDDRPDSGDDRPGSGDDRDAGSRDDGPRTGSVGVLHEVTERERRENELDVLKQLLARVLRHDVRTGLTVIQGQAEVLAERTTGEKREMAERVLDRSEQLVETTEKVRAIEQVIDGDDEWVTLDLRTVVNRAVADVATDHPDAEYDATITERLPVRVHRAFPYAVENLVENAVEHNAVAETTTDAETVRNAETGTEPDTTAGAEAEAEGTTGAAGENAAIDGAEATDEAATDETGGRSPPGDRPRVTVSATPGEETVALHVADDGPGIAAEELEVLDEREERPLKHGSGVGLWLVDWVVDRSGGHVEFDTGSEGTTVTVEVPRGDPADLGHEEFPEG